MFHKRGNKDTTNKKRTPDDVRFDQAGIGSGLYILNARNPNRTIREITKTISQS
ncbi:MAG TPA: hypothetical protein DCY14_11775 [Anaerolineae bacterium]|nr:hypothetical protein [Anaerolineae bacterium]